MTTMIGQPSVHAPAWSSTELRAALASRANTVVVRLSKANGDRELDRLGLRYVVGLTHAAGAEAIIDLGEEQETHADDLLAALAAGADGVAVPAGLSKRMGAEKPALPLHLIVATPEDLVDQFDLIMASSDLVGLIVDVPAHEPRALAVEELTRLVAERHELQLRVVYEPHRSRRTTHSSAEDLERVAG